MQKNVCIVLNGRLQKSVSICLYFLVTGNVKTRSKKLPYSLALKCVFFQMLRSTFNFKTVFFSNFHSFFYLNSLLCLEAQCITRFKERKKMHWAVHQEKKKTLDSHPPQWNDNLNWIIHCAVKSGVDRKCTDRKKLCAVKRKLSCSPLNCPRMKAKRSLMTLIDIVHCWTWQTQVSP